ncbi:ABC transporter permease [Arthrobacter sp. NPDC056727]|uniref:ABC transporter permease n=1 Tax=Arthrobacter sp. NPDC056727 TaxID=3345927 RepID=UPI0036707FCB
MQTNLSAPPRPQQRLSAPKLLRNANVKVQARFGRVAVIATVIVAWELLTRFGLIDIDFVSTPLAVAGAFVEMLGTREVMTALGSTGGNILMAFAIGTTVGIVVGTVMGLSKTLWQAYSAPLLFLMSTPKSIFLPIFILLCGIGSTSAVVFGAFEAAVFVTINVAAGMALVEDRHMKVARAFKASWGQTILNVVLPSALPGIFTALWFGIRHAFIGVLIAELWASSDGVGGLIRVYAEQLHTDKTLALMLAVTILAVVAGTIWNHLETRLTKWRQTSAAGAATTTATS